MTPFLLLAAGWALYFVLLAAVARLPRKNNP